MMADEVETVVAETLVGQSAMPACEFATRVIDTDVSVAESCGDGACLGQSAAFITLARWIMSVQQAGAPTEAALEWVRDTLGAECAMAATTATATVSRSPAGTTAIDHLGDDLLPALVWLAAGLTAAYGNSDPQWLRRHDPPRRRRFPRRSAFSR